MEPDYDAVNEMIEESIMEEIGGMNANEFVESIAGKNLPNDHDIGGIVMTMTDSNFLDRDSMSVNDVWIILERITIQLQKIVLMVLSWELLQESLIDDLMKGVDNVTT